MLKPALNSGLKLVLGLLLVLAAVSAARHFGLPSCSEIQARVGSGGLWQVLGFIGLFVLASVLFVPGTILGIAAGVAFGPWLGTLLVSVGSVAGAVAAFAISRYVARDWVEERLVRRRWYQRFRENFQANSFSYLLFLRLSPIFPYNGLNYACGVLPVRFSEYFISSVLGMLPGTFAYVYVGYAAGCSAGASPDLFIALGLLSVLALLPLWLPARRTGRHRSQK